MIIWKKPSKSISMVVSIRCHLKIDNGIPKKIILSTDNFTQTVVQQLLKLIRTEIFLIFFIRSSESFSAI